MKNTTIFKYLVLILGFFQYALAEPLSTKDSYANIKIEKNESEEYIVHYEFATPTDTVFFFRNPDNSRQKRWTPLSPDIYIDFDGEQELIKSRSNKKITRASFVLTPTYTVLPEDYAPFMPFSDGGLAIYTGRYFVCNEKCSDKISYKWHFTFESALPDNIVYDGRVSQKSAAWVDSGSGQNIYVGPQLPLSTKKFNAVIDPGLPSFIKNQLNTAFPLMMDYFSDKLGEVRNKPFLFASYNKNQDKFSGAQGGTLPGQVFMHWFGPNLEERLAAKTNQGDLIWFFAHEAAHFYQPGDSNIESAWIHEGGAELMAYLSLKELFPEFRNYAQTRLDWSAKKCSKLLGTNEFKRHYYCGLIYLLKLHNDVLESSQELEGIFQIFKDYEDIVEVSGDAGRDSFFKALDKLTNASLRNDLLKKIKLLESNK